MIPPTWWKNGDCLQHLRRLTGDYKHIETDLWVRRKSNQIRVGSKKRTVVTLEISEFAQAFNMPGTAPDAGTDPAFAAACGAEFGLAGKYLRTGNWLGLISPSGGLCIILDGAFQQQLAESVRMNAWLVASAQW